MRLYFFYLKWVRQQVAFSASPFSQNRYLYFFCAVVLYLCHICIEENIRKRGKRRIKWIFLPLWCHFFPPLVSVKRSKPSTKTGRKGLKCVCPLVSCCSAWAFFPFSIYSIGSFISKGLQQPDLPWFSREHPPPPVFNYLLSYCCTFSPFSSWFDLAKQTRAALTWQYILAEGIPSGWTHPHLAQSPQSCLCLPHRAAGMWIKARIRETTAAPNGLAIYNSF